MVFDTYDKKVRAMLSKMAHEDPNKFIEYLYHAGMDADEKEDLFYLLQIARRAPGYDPEQDLFRKEGIL